MAVENNEQCLDAANYRCDAPSAPPAPLLAHYTDGAALIKILEQGALWASDARYLNDRAEVEHGRALVRQILGERLKEADEAEREMLENLLVESEATFTFSLPVVTCFSRSVDSLGQWRGYGQGRTRFALEFDEEVLRKLADQQHFQLVDCIYGAEHQHSALSAILDHELGTWRSGKRRSGVGRMQLVENIRRRFPTYDEVMRELEVAARERRPMSREHAEQLRSLSSQWSQFQWELSPLLMQLKHPSFNEEFEVRAMKQQDEDGDLKFRESQHAIVPFTEFRFREAGDRGALRTIRVGPGQGFSETKDVLERLLFRNRYDGVEVVPSSCTLRA